ncbi:hypothetical protein Q31a_19600 [Aureliella helgolandensis]|uniref:Uncharacterized protein n=1 Tax=Aureliella helgolandensis TaxID=2527968 RepID=A0A518G4X6_9BACT|nr:hypothetical protein Q31a_19600 [Aureliella helgolandensis]
MRTLLLGILLAAKAAFVDASEPTSPNDSDIC